MNMIFKSNLTIKKPAATDNSGITIMKIMEIGKDLTISFCSTKQKGYGRQGLYLTFNEVEGSYYIQDVYPNVEEYFDILLFENSFEKTRDADGRFCKKYYTDSAGNGEYDRHYDTVIQYLIEEFEGFEIEIDEDEDEDEDEYVVQHKK